LIADEPDEDVQVSKLERLAVQTSIENLFTFPFVQSRFEEGKLSLHGLWLDIGAGNLEFYQPSTEDFQPV
jgi:carbonic anhydrase